MIEFLTKVKNSLCRKDNSCEVKFDDVGIYIFEHGKLVTQVVWTSVLEVFAYKEDRFTFDDICLGFRVNADGTYWMISEDYIGYQALLDELKRRYDGIRTDWFSEVAFPAFATNRTTLWGESWDSKD